MLHIVLFEPQIPQNTGNIGRLCAITKSCLHLIHPLGFSITDKHLKRSGMDYWKSLDIKEYLNWDSFCEKNFPKKRLWLLSTKAHTPIWNARFQDEDMFLFGNEGCGLPESIHSTLDNNVRLTIPQFNPNLRSLNLSTSVGIVVYEALRQIHSKI